MRGWISGTLAGIGAAMLCVTFAPGLLSSEILESSWLPYAQILFF